MFRTQNFGMRHQQIRQRLSFSECDRDLVVMFGTANEEHEFEDSAPGTRTQDCRGSALVAEAVNRGQRMKFPSVHVTGEVDDARQTVELAESPADSCWRHNVKSCVMCRQLEESRLAMLASVKALMEAVPGGGWRC